MAIQEIKAKSILLKRKKIDSWFVSRYGMNLYRGCGHSCIYCDGRSERYQIGGNFEEDIVVKANAVEILRNELKPIGRRVKLKPGYVMIGGGVGDSYQPLEEKYQLTRRTLQLLEEYRWPVHILTKSTLVERDMDVIKRINRQNRAIVSFSFSSANGKVSAIFEPNVPAPNKRFETIASFKKEGIACGVFLLPVIPFITDTPKMIVGTLRKAREIGVDFVVFGGMTLKAGKQKDHFYTVLGEKYPELIPKYEEIYEANEWGQATQTYYNSINSVYNRAAKMFGLKRRMPPTLFNDILWENDLVVVLLEQLDYFLQLEGKRSPFGYAAYSISKLKTPLSALKSKLRTINGVGEKTEQIIIEILNTKGSAYYDSLS